VHQKAREGWRFGEAVAGESKRPAEKVAERADVPARDGSRPAAAADPRRERRAQDLLNVARGALRRGQRTAARSFLKKIVSDYPGTGAAKEAARLLGE
jgi:TolA-binding protein